MCHLSQCTASLRGSASTSWPKIATHVSAESKTHPGLSCDAAHGCVICITSVFLCFSFFFFSFAPRTLLYLVSNALNLHLLVLLTSCWQAVGVLMAFCCIYGIVCQYVAFSHSQGCIFRSFCFPICACCLFLSAHLLFSTASTFWSLAESMALSPFQVSQRGEAQVEPCEV